MKLRWVIASMFCFSAFWHTEELASAEALMQVADRGAPKLRVEPQILSLFPLGASRDTRSRLHIDVRGYGLENAYVVWTDCQSISAEVKTVEEMKPEEHETSAKDAVVYRVALELSVAPDVGIGTHFIRIITPSGVSNASAFVIHEGPVVSEADLPSSDLAPAARRLPVLPVVVSGKISKEGETDTYSFEADPGQELFLEVLSGGKLDPQITIYEPAASWFDPRAVRRLAFNDEPNTASKNLNSSLTYRFDRKGPFLTTVGAFLGRGGPDCSYQLRIVPAAQRGIPMTTPKLAHKLDGGWEEHSFARELGLDRLTALAARTTISTETMSPGRPESKVANVALTAASNAVAPEVDRPGAKPATDVVSVAKGEPNRTLNQTREISLPALIEGTIDRPGGVDHFRFRVNDGTRLAFEIETPAKPAPFFAPRLAVFDQRGQEVLNNIYAFVQGSGEFIEKVVEPKVISNFEQGGEYLLEVRDLTFRSGGPDFRYRVLIRPQIPHVGRIDVAFSLGRSLDGSLKMGTEVEHLNLVPGEAKKITVLSELEEGFDGQIAFGFEGLPQGVEAFPAAEVEPARPGVLDEGKKERFLPGSQRVTIVLATSPDAPVTRVPHLARLNARPVINGKFGIALPVQAIPVMVVHAEGAN